MKKIIVFFSLFGALIFAVGCGDGSKANDEKNDSEVGVSDSDDTYTTEDADAITENDDQPDSDNKTPDENDSQSCEKENPCAAIDNSTGECSIQNGKIVCGCNENYTWNGESCIADTRSASCSGLPANAEWNTVSEITQLWNGEQWLPSTEGSYCENASESECCFKCMENYHWIDSKCLPECSPESGTPCVDLSAGLVWSEKSGSTMHWNDSFEYCTKLNEGGFDDWRMPSIKVLNTIVRNCDSASGCEGDSNGKYSVFGEISVLWSATAADSGNAQAVNFYDGSTATKNADESFYTRCVRGNLTTRTVDCELEQEHAFINEFTTIEQHWDWDEMWIPSNIAVFGEQSQEGECRFKCEEGYGWNSKICLDMQGAVECDGHPASFPCIDLATGYFWSNQSSSKMEWSSAKTYCSSVTDGGFDNWRLPTINELRSVIKNCSKTETGGACLVTDSCTKNDCYVADNCSCAQNNTPGYYSKLNFSDDYWTSTYNASAGDNSWNWYVSFNNAEVMDCKNGNAFLESSASHKVVCVRY